MHLTLLPSKPSTQMRRRRRPALLLEVLIAMALLSMGLGILFRGPLLLLRSESQAMRSTALEWEIDRQFMLMMSQLIEKGPERVRPEPVAIEVRAGQQAPLKGQIAWKVYREVEQEPEPVVSGRFYRLIATVSLGKQTLQRQRSIFIESLP
jgi:type II secretory pathway component PulJ